METLGNIHLVKSRKQKYECQHCDYTTSRLYDYEKHLSTDKHKMLVNASKISIKCECGKSYRHIESLYRHKKVCDRTNNHKAKVVEVVNCFQMFPNQEEGNICECGRSYRTRSGLWKHQKSCKLITGVNHAAKNPIEQSDDTNNKDIMNVLDTLNMKLDKTSEDNKLLKEKLNQLESGVMTAVSEPKVVNNYNNIIVLLNQKCGDAVGIDDFAKEIAMSLEDVSYALENGKAKGIENIIRKRFEELGTFSRPLHCTDVKRGTTYVKGDEGWEKDNGRINKMIKDVEFVQTKGIKMWGDANPSYSQGNSKLMDKWLQIVKCLTGSIEGVGMRKIEKRCHEMTKIDQEEWR